MKPAAERAVVHEVDRQTKAVVDIVSRWPEYRSHIAYAMLGAAVATCDTFGLDVEGWLAALRAHTPKPDALVPPSGRQS